MYKVNFDYIPLIAVVAVSIIFIILLATLTNAANVLNSSPINSNGFRINTTAKLPTTNEKKTVVVAPPDAKTTETYGNQYPTGKIFPITIHGGKLVGILADENMASMTLVLDPRNMTIEMPRIVIVP